MEIVVEYVSYVLAWLVYGTDERPRHPVWRNAVRGIAFAGVFIALGVIYGAFDRALFSPGVQALWVLCSLIVICGEYYLGSKPIAYAAFASLAVLILAMLVV